MEITKELRNELLLFQKNELTEHYIYKRLAKSAHSQNNRNVLDRIAADELRHYHGWKQYTQTDVNPNLWNIQKFYWLSRIFGLTFGLQLMERGEETAAERYGQFRSHIREIESYIEDEQNHEQLLIQLIDEKHLHYVGSIVLGLNDALVELTGALAGFTLALQNTRLIALTGVITGVAAALSMSASEYLSTRAEKTSKDPAMSAVYTGIAYILTVIILILPYLIIQNYYFALCTTIVLAILIIAAFNYYISVVRNEQFRSRFFEMAGVSIGVAVFSFLLGYLFRSLFGIAI